MVVLHDWMQYAKCKDILYQFCAQFKKLPANDLEFLKAQRDLLSQHPELNHYFYQFFFAAAYHKKCFNDFDIMKAFSETFTVKDVYGLNQGLSDASTVNTAFVVYQLAQRTPFKGFPFTIFSTPLDYTSVSYNTAKNHFPIEAHRIASEKMTGNVNCDLAIGDRLYDIKDTRETNTARNHVYAWTSENAEIKLANFLKSVFLNLQRQPESIIVELLKNKLENIIKDTTLTWCEKNNLWNSVYRDFFERIPKTVPIPIVLEIPTKSSTFITNKTKLEKIQVSADVTDNAASARRAICGVVDNPNKPWIKSNAIIMTNNGLSFPTHENNSNDYPD